MALMRPQGIPRLNRASPLARGLVAWWPFIGELNVLRDFSENGHDMVDGSTAISLNTLPNFGKAGEFPTDVNAAFTITSKLGFTDYPITFGGWGRPTLNDRRAVLLSFCDSAQAASDQNYVAQDRSGPGGWRLRFNSVDLGANFVFDLVVPTLFIGVAASATDRRMYINGVQVGNATASVSWPVDSNTWAVGVPVTSSPSDPWDGPIVECFVWKRGLTDAQVWALYDPKTRWDLYQQPAFPRIAYSFSQFVAAVVVETEFDFMFHGLITLDIESSFLSDANTLNSGVINPTIIGSLLEDTDTFNQGEAIFAGQLQGSLLEDVDTFFDSRIVLPMFGSILEDADTLFHGDFDLQIFGSLLEDADTFFQANVHPAEILGSLFQDSDSIFGGEIGGITDIYKILIVSNIVGGDIVDLVDEVVLTDAKGAITGSVEGEFKVATQDDTV